MTIGEQLLTSNDSQIRPDDYGIVRWTPPAGSDGSQFSFTVRVTDQENNSETVVVDGVVDNSRFVFVAPENGSPNGDGTLSSPLRGFAALYGNNVNDSTYAGRLAYFRGGNYVLSGDSANSNNNARLNGSIKPIVWRAYPGENPVFDCSGAKVFFSGSMDDCCFDGIRWENGRQDVNNAHFIYAASLYNRGLFWRNYFFNLDRGRVGNDNPAAIFLSASSSHRRYCAVVSNVFDRMGPGGGNGVAGYDSYAHDYALFENNEARNCTSTHCLWLKGGHRWTTVRGERASDNNSPGLVLLNIMCGRDGNTERSESVEVRYCASKSLSANALRFHWASSASENGPLWIYRCSVDGDVGALHTNTATVTLERCVFTDTDLPMGTTTTYDDNTILTASDFGNDLELSGSARSDWLGTHGFEVG